MNKVDYAAQISSQCFSSIDLGNKALYSPKLTSNNRQLNDWQYSYCIYWIDIDRKQ
ncbi:hypothetical protein [Shewanella baltica]|uniref:hypothetical protein n=1 Tax=Shewanella baltica TaxID=62322 RepID=UPI0012F89E71|nr:hypothetical protein [Shewanella baltica]